MVREKRYAAADDGKPVPSGGRRGWPTANSHGKQHRRKRPENDRGSGREGPFTKLGKGEIWENILKGEIECEAKKRTNNGDETHKFYQKNQ